MEEQILEQELKLGIESLDKNYQQFFQKSSQLLASIERKNELSDAEIERMNAFFRNYLEDHFKEEEELQQELNYPYYEEHKRTHQILYNRINKLMAEVKEKQVKNNEVYKIYNEIRSLVKAHIYYIDQGIKKQIVN